MQNKSKEFELIRNDCGKTEENEVKRSVTKQIILGLLTNFTIIAPSMSLGFSAIALPVLTKSDDLNALTTTQASWFASIASLATPIGCLISGPLSDKYGRRLAFYLINLITFIGWLTISFACKLNDNRYIFLMIGRILTGLSTGLASMPSNIYMTEIASLKLRGVFSTWSTISFSTGILVVYSLGYFLQDSLSLIALITATFPLISTILIVFFVPESPEWLIMRKRYEKAKNNLIKIYDIKLNEEAELIGNLIENRKVVIKSCDNSDRTDQTTKTVKIMNKIRLILTPTCLKPFLIITIYFFIQQFSGIFVIVFYAIDIVKVCDIKINSYLVIIIIALTRLLSSLLVSYISKIIGRRPLSLLSGFGVSASMLLLSLYLFLINLGKFPVISSLPVIAFVIYFFTSTLGFLPLPFAMTPELFSSKIRGTVAGLITCIAYLFNFIIVKIYPNMLDLIGSEGIFLFYGIVASVGTIFIWAFLPETKGKSLKEIEEFFSKSSNN